MAATVLKGFTLGFVAFAATETIWLLFAPPDTPSAKWVMGSNLGLAFTLLVYAGIGLLISFRPHRVALLAFCTLGVATAVVVMMFAIGPGNLWPIVIVMDWALLAPALLVGFASGWLLRRLVLDAA